MPHESKSFFFPGGNRMTDQDIATSYPMFTTLNHNNRSVQITREESGRGIFSKNNTGWGTRTAPSLLQ